MWAVKLGGSLLDSANLTGWLSALADLGAVIVPGGGVFADTVREQQHQKGFDDRAAHDMAILAMAQTGRMLLALNPALTPFQSAEAGPWPANSTAVWLPNPRDLDLPDIPASWDVTSDSLACWLAKRIGVSALLLVKTPPRSELDPEGRGVGAVSALELARRGVIDAAFPDFMARTCVPVYLCGSEDFRLLPEALAQPERAFLRLQL